MPSMTLRDGRRVHFREGLNPDDVYAQVMADDPAHQQRVAAQQASDSKEYNPTTGMGANERRWAGAQRGVADVGRNIGNMLGLVSDADMADRAKLDAPLLATAHGRQGNFVGNTAALTALTAPLGGALGLATRAAAPTSALARTLGSGAGNVMAQGALGGAVSAAPNQRGSGATLGGLLGLGTYGVLKGAGKLAGGIARQSPDAIALEHATGARVPFSTGLDPTHGPSRFLRTLGSIATEAPMSATMLGGQRTAALNTFVAEAGRRAVPKLPGLGAVEFTSGVTPAARLANQANVAKVDYAIQQLITPLKGVEFKLAGPHYSQSVGASLKRVMATDPALYPKIMSVLDEAMPPGMGATNGERVLQAISKLKALRNEVGGTSGTGQAEKIGDVVAGLQKWGELRLGPTPARAAWQRVTRLHDKELWGWENFKRGVAKGRDGEITPSNLVSGMKGGVTSQSIGGMPNQDFLTLGSRVFDREGAHLGGGFRTGVATGVPIPGMLDTLLSTAASPALAVLSTKGVQRALTGDLASQKILTAALTRNPNLLRNIAARTTNAMTEGN